MSIKEITGGISAVAGVKAGGTSCGIKQTGVKDLAIIAVDAPCSTAAVFTRNKIRAACIDINRQHLENGLAQAVVINSGCANACTGTKGTEDAGKMAATCAEALGIKPEDVLVASTGHIGDYLPMDKIEQGIDQLAPNINPEGGEETAEAIMTTDTYPKKTAVEFECCGKTITIGGIAKGAGMIEPDMATMLCFLATDACIDGEFLRKSLADAVSRSFNRITVDGDQSTNDSVILFATGNAQNTEITFGEGEQEFQKALDYVCLRLAKMIVKDGEGATKFLEIKVAGADSQQNALIAAKKMANSMLFKCAVYGNDPNWGRLMASLGGSGVYVSPEKVDVYFGDLHVVKDGRELAYNHEKLEQIMSENELYITVDLNLGSCEERVWTCDLTHKYVDINMV